MISRVKAKLGTAALSASALLLLPSPALAQGFLDTLLGTMMAQTDNWMQRGVEVALMIFMSLALIEFAWHGIQLVLKKGELSELFGGVVLKVTALGFFYTLIVFSPQWIPLISQTFEAAGQRISGLPSDQLTPSNLIDRGIRVSTMVYEAPLQSFSLMEIGRSLLTSIIAALTAIMIFIAFLVVAIQLLVVKVEMLLVISGGVVMLAMSGSRWSLSFAEKYIGYAVSVGAKLIVISILAGFGTTFGDSIVAELGRDNRVLQAPQLFSLMGTSGIFAVMSYMIPSLAGSFLSGAASMSLANTAAAGGSMGSMVGSGVGRATGVAAGAAGGALGAVAKLATPAGAVGSISGLASGVKSAAGSVGSIGGAAARGGSAFSSSSRSSAASSKAKGSSAASAAQSQLQKTGSAGVNSAASSAPGSSSSQASGGAPAQGGGQKAGFANPRAAEAGAASGGVPTGQQAMGAGPMDYREQERLAERDFRARASANPFARAMLKASDKLKDVGEKSSAFARRQRRPMASDGHTGGSPTIRLGMSGD